MARVELEGVSKVFAGEVTAVEGLDLSVADGELVVLVGPSGSGKSTILRLIAGLEQPTTGDIRIGERVVTKLPPRDRDLAYVPQSCPLYPHLNVAQNLAFGGRMRHAATFLTRWWRHNAPSGSWTRAEEDRRVQQVARRLGIGHLLERWPRQLSGGERQRVALGRAIVREPAAFLFDEPLSSLDIHLRRELRGELKQLHRELGRTMVYVTHDQAEATALADRLVVLDQGRVRQIGPVEEVWNRPRHRFVGWFMSGAAPMNFLRGTIQVAGPEGFFVGGAWKLKLPLMLATELRQRAGKVELGLRADGLELTLPDVPGAHLATVRACVRLGEMFEVSLAPLAADDAQPGELLLARSGMPLTPGSQVGWRPDWSRSHWFQLPGGERVELAANAFDPSAHRPTI